MIMDIDKIIIAPVISEKSINSTAKNRYTFLVANSASKGEIKLAVQKHFGVDVLDIKVINIRGKKVRFGRKKIEGQKNDKRKAIVTIKAEQKIDVFDIGQDKK